MKKVFILRSEQQIDALEAFVANNWQAMSRNGQPMQITISEYNGSRSDDQLAAMWAGIIQPIADQAYINGQRYSAETWHEYLKQLVLPEMAKEDEHGEWFKSGGGVYRYMPDGSRQFVGSTGKLTKKGMGEYMGRIEAYAVQELGVRLPVSPYA
jgi:hypothetical protein